MSAEKPVAQDFVWRFTIDEKPPDDSPLDPTRELLRSQWEQLLGLCVPMRGDRPVEIDGFALMRESGRVVPVHLDDPRWGRR